MWMDLFLLYLANYFIVVFFNVGLVYSAFDRMAGGHASIDQGLQVAWDRKGRIFQWAVVAATFGVLMKIAARRLNFIERLGLDLIGVAWGIATVFIAPVLAVEDVGPVEALQRSSQILTETWGKIGWRLLFRTVLFHPRNSQYPTAGLAVSPLRCDRSDRELHADGCLRSPALRHQRCTSRSIKCCLISLRHEEGSVKAFPARRLLDSLATEAVANISDQKGIRGMTFGIRCRDRAVRNRSQQDSQGERQGSSVPD